MASIANPVSCNFSPPPLKPRISSKFLSPISLRAPKFPKMCPISFTRKTARLQIRHSSLNTQPPQDPPLTSPSSDENEIRGSGGGGDGEERDWTTSILLFAFWIGLMSYVFFIAPNQTPATDLYFLKKLLNLTGDDGFVMNSVFVSEWYIMGLWPLVYSMLLIPSARSIKSKIPVWPFLALSCAGGVYALIPYFVLWNPPAPPVEESELRRWPLNFLESKLTAGVTFAAGLALIVYALSSGNDVWKEFSQYVRGSKFTHIMTIDFALLSTFAPFWVYNDLTTRKRSDNGSWLIPLSLIPFLGPSLYLILRPPLSTLPSEET